MVAAKGLLTYTVWLSSLVLPALALDGHIRADGHHLVNRAGSLVGQHMNPERAILALDNDTTENALERRAT